MKSASFQWPGNLEVLNRQKHPCWGPVNLEILKKSMLRTCEPGNTARRFILTTCEPENTENKQFWWPVVLEILNKSILMTSEPGNTALLWVSELTVYFGCLNSYFVYIIYNLPDMDILKQSHGGTQVIGTDWRCIYKGIFRNFPEDLFQNWTDWRSMYRDLFERCRIRTTRYKLFIKK